MSLSCPAAPAAVLPAHFFDVNMDGEAREEGDLYAVAMGNKSGLFESADNWGASKPDVRFILIQADQVRQGVRAVAGGGAGDGTRVAHGAGSPCEETRRRRGDCHA